VDLGDDVVVAGVGDDGAERVAEGLGERGDVEGVHAEVDVDLVVADGDAGDRQAGEGGEPVEGSGL